MIKNMACLSTDCNKESSSGIPESRNPELKHPGRFNAVIDEPNETSKTPQMKCQEEIQ